MKKFNVELTLAEIQQILQCVDDCLVNAEPDECPEWVETLHSKFCKLFNEAKHANS